MNIYEIGELFLSRRRPFILGISPGNPYYVKNENLIKLLTFAADRSDEVKLFIPEVALSVHNYNAVGAKTPEKSARKKSTAVRNKVQNNLENIDVDKEKFSYVDWNEVEKAEPYQEKLSEISTLYSTPGKFRSDTNEDTQKVLKRFMEGRNQHDSVDTVDIEEGSLYLRKELAFFDVVPALWKNFEETCYVYNTALPLFEKYFGGEYDDRPRRHFGLVVHV